MIRFDERDSVKAAFTSDSTSISLGSLEVEFFLTFDRTTNIDSMGFPCDTAVVMHLKKFYSGNNANSILVTPTQISDSLFFKTMDKAFIDESVIMKLKWPIGEAALSDKAMKAAWFSVCFNVIIRCIEAGLPVAMSVSTYRRAYIEISHLCIFKVRHILGISKVSSYVTSQASSRNLNPEVIINNYKKESAYLRDEDFHEDIDYLYYIDHDAFMGEKAITAAYHRLKKIGYITHALTESRHISDRAKFCFRDKFHPSNSVRYLAYRICLHEGSNVDHKPFQIPDSIKQSLDELLNKSFNVAQS
jgi:hypothetical protein